MITTNHFKDHRYPSKRKNRSTGSLTATLLIVMLLILVCATREAVAQSGGFSGAYTRMGFGPRGMAMGNAIGTVTREGIYGHYNPALAAYSNGNQIDLSTAIMDFDRSLHSVNVTFPLPPNAGLNIGLLNANVYNIDGRTTSGYHTEYLSTHEFQLFAAFGISISPRVKIGVSAKLHLASYLDAIDNTTGAGFDIGMIVEPLPDWRIGFTIQDIISEYSWDTNNIYGTLGGRSRNDPIPVRFRFSSSYTIAAWGLLLSSEFEVQRQMSEYSRLQSVSTALPPQNTRSTDKLNTSSNQFRLGAAWIAHERITLRGGWEVLDLDFISETQKISTGFSVHLPYDTLKPSVDYAFIREPLGISGMHVLSLRLSL